MADLTPPQRGAYERLGPTTLGQQAILPVSLTATASYTDLNSTWGQGASPASKGLTTRRIEQGGAWFSFQSQGGVAQIRFHSSGTTPAAGASATNACTVDDGRTEEFWVPSTTPFVDAVGSAAMTLKVWMSSRNVTQIAGTG